jgi:hypothetical protein
MLSIIDKKINNLTEMWLIAKFKKPNIFSWKLQFYVVMTMNLPHKNMIFCQKVKQTKKNSKGLFIISLL